MRRVSKIATAVLFFSLFLSPPVFSADETVTITTYYPSPNGSYRDLHSNQMGVGTDYQTGVLPNNSLVVQANVGIGTTSPIQALHLSSSGATALRIDAAVNTNPGIQLWEAGTQKWAVYNRNSDDAMIFWTSGGGGSIFYLGAGGNVGIGTVSPQAKLDVAGGVKIGNDTAACNAAKEGTTRYNSTLHVTEYCNGTNWISNTLGTQDCYVIRPDRWTSNVCKDGFYMKAIYKWTDDNWDGYGSMCCRADPSIDDPTLPSAQTLHSQCPWGWSRITCQSQSTTQPAGMTYP